MKADVTTLAAKKSGSLDLADGIFGLVPRRDLLHRMVVYQLAKRRAGTANTQGRSDVTGTTKKYMRQKGSGGARHGNKKVSQMRGGGVAFGPQPRDHAIKLPKKVRVLALKHALSAKARAKELVVLDSASVKKPKTSDLRKSLEKLGLASVLIVDGEELDANFQLAARNIAGVDVLPARGINVYDILRRDKLVLTKAAIEVLEARLK